ncbi:MAG: hypothetical protein K6D98_03035 [Clostridiales bacterium]|nr:hypothetical protein [Clostridiales bacterium]
MAEKNNCCFGIGDVRAAADKSTCINVEKIYDSARDKDCIEDLRVFLDQNGQSAIDHATSIRSKCADVIWANIAVSDVAFNRGYFAVDIRFYFRICFEATIPYSQSQEFCGIAVYDKQIVMFGSEGNVGIFTSDFCNNNLPGTPSVKYSTNLPKVVLEVATPICLAIKLVDRTCRFGLCCCSPEQIPESICTACGVFPTEEFGLKCLYVSLGVFSMIRMQRPVSLLINAADYCIPDKTSNVLSETDPCSVFNNMSFPTCEFYPPTAGGALSNNIAGASDVCNPSDVLGSTTASTAQSCRNQRCR